MRKLVFEPGRWHSCRKNDFLGCDRGVNCYAYMLNKPEYHWAVPGLGFAQTKARVFIESFNRHFKKVRLGEFRQRIIDGAIKDGLLPTKNPKGKKGYYLAALFFSNKINNLDFHWYRKDGDGLWSHKDGWLPASDRDSKGKPIHDPRKDTQSGYPAFGGFFWVPRKGVKLARTFPVLPKTKGEKGGWPKARTRGKDHSRTYKSLPRTSTA